LRVVDEKPSENEINDAREHTDYYVTRDLAVEGGAPSVCCFSPMNHQPTEGLLKINKLLID